MLYAVIVAVAFLLFPSALSAEQPKPDMITWCDEVLRAERSAAELSICARMYRDMFLETERYAAQLKSLERQHRDELDRFWKTRYDALHRDCTSAIRSGH